ncbi:MAG TPA: STAS domain-containing protein [Bacillus sp. (in: firmicutes)]|nr:STAS domain-containing protein [Bacillus sp. (in: firmicutes)]
MKDELRYIGEKIVENNYTLAQNVADLQDAEYTQRLEYGGLPLSERIENRAEIIRYLGMALYEDLNDVSEKVTAWGEKAAQLAIQYNVPLSDFLRAISTYRTVIWNVFTEELEQRQFTPITMLDVSKIIDPFLDKISSIVGEIYENHTHRLMKIAYTALEELSVPVVPIAEGIAVIPIVGEIDTHRSKLIMDVSLSEGARLKLKHIILDISGVPIIDTMVADKIFQIVKALRLTGIETIITGIRPETAQTIVALGLSFSDIKTRANMQQALKELGFRQVPVQS